MWASHDQELASADPHVAPLINSNFLSDPLDTETLTYAIRRAIEFADAPAMQAIGAKFHDVPHPSCIEVRPHFSDAYWECHLRHNTMSLYHDVGTCRMGNRAKEEAVVSKKLKVHGVRGLRVADASVFPSHVSANPMATVLMVAEMVAEFIKESS